MLSLLNNLKGQLTVLNGIMMLIILAFIFYRYQKRNATIFFAGIAIFTFLLCSTAYLPNYLADKLERKYPPYAGSFNSADTSKVFIIVLGSGYTLDKRLPATAQIGLGALGRLAEGIRVHRSVKNSTLIFCGHSSLGLETQAQVTRKAAILLGVDANKIETLDNPSNTQEEAQEAGIHYSRATQLIIVTDAIHMPRAVRLFRRQGFKPVAAPTNYKVNEGPDEYGMKWWPSLGNIGLMNYVIHEWLGNLKASLS